MGTNTNKNKHTVPYIKIEEIKINIYSQSLTNCPSDWRQRLHHVSFRTENATLFGRGQASGGKKVG